MIHALKIAPQFFMEVAIGAKTFEVRKDDRGGFNPNDILILAEWNGEGETGRYLKARVTYVLNGGDYGIDKDYCVMSIKKVGEE